MNLFNKCIRYIQGFLMIVIINLMLIMANSEYACKNVFLWSNIIIIIFDIILLIVIRGGGYVFGNVRVTINYDIIAYLSTILLFIIEMYIGYNVHFKTGWDASVVWDNANRIAFLNSDGLNNGYYSQNPNNMLITLIAAMILKLNSMIGIFRGDDTYLALIVVNCICISIACYLVYKVLKHFVSKQFAFAGYILAVCLIGLSPWITIYYSDTLGTLFPILIVYIYIWSGNSKWKKIMKYIAVILLSAFGYYIKPQVLIVTIAIFIIDMCYALKKDNRKQIVCNVIILLGMALCFTGVGKCLDTAYERAGFKINPEARFGMTHYFMMGLNEERNGVWAAEDVNISGGCQTAEERRDMNMKVSVQRLKDFGIFGYAKHLSKKLLCIFNDGTFAWRHEGGFFQVIYEEPNTCAAPFIRSFYYADGKNLDRFMLFEQQVWIFILGMVLSAALWHRASESMKNSSVIMLCLIGITTFEVLFEARARYLFLFTPIFCVTAAIGFREAWIKIDIVLKRVKNI